MQSDITQSMAQAHRLIDRAAQQTVALSQRIHSAPELGYEEVRAVEWIAEDLTSHGFVVESDFCNIPTAFRARYGTGSLNLALLAEYDALPGIGHACGHNMIAASALAAAVGLRAVADDLDITVTVIGTPAEETLARGGKILLLERGGFEGVHAAMMVHPTPFEVAAPSTFAALSLDFSAKGVPAHASAAPERGRNAADALVIGQVAVGLLRQHMTSDNRVSGIVRNAGEAPNIIPNSAEAQYVLRTDTLEKLGPLRGRVEDCFHGGGLASGCAVEVSGGERPYAELRSDDGLVAMYEAEAAAAGRVFSDPSAYATFIPSTDAGNVSQFIPTIHPYLGLNTWPVVNHQAEFAQACATTQADSLTVVGGKLLSGVGIRAASNPETRRRLQKLKSDTRVGSRVVSSSEGTA